MMQLNPLVLEPGPGKIPHDGIHLNFGDGVCLFKRGVLFQYKIIPLGQHRDCIERAYGRYLGVLVVIAPPTNAEQAPVTKTLGEAAVHVRQLHKRLVIDPEDPLVEPIEDVSVKPTIGDHEVWLEFHLVQGEIQPLPNDRGKIPAADPLWHDDVDVCVILVDLGPGLLPRFLPVGVNVKEILIVTEELFRAIAVVEVLVDVENFLGMVFRPRLVSSTGDIVQITKTPVTARARVVSADGNGREGIRAFTRHDVIHRLHHPPTMEQGRVQESRALDILEEDVLVAHRERKVSVDRREIGLHDKFLVIEEVVLCVEVVQLFHAYAKVCDGDLFEVFWMVDDFRDHYPNTEGFIVLLTLNTYNQRYFKHSSGPDYYGKNPV